jgi:uncharacterized protein (DUF849 family)
LKTDRKSSVQTLLICFETRARFNNCPLAASEHRDSGTGMPKKEFSAQRIQGCLNGNRSSKPSLSLPVTPEGLASDAGIAANLGFFSVHVHPRGDVGRKSLKEHWVGAAVSAIREAAPGIEIGVSTGAWIEPDLAERIAAINAWKILPDVASANLFEYGADKVTGSFGRNPLD